MANEASCAHGARPPAHERDFVRRDEMRRAQVQQKRPRRIEARPRAELLPARRRPHREEIVEPRRAGDDDVVCRNVVIRHRLPLLVLVPDEHAIGRDPHEAPVGQVVPAERQKRDRDPEAVRALDVVGLIRAEIDERRDQDDVRGVRADEELVVALARNQRSASSSAA